MVDREGRPDPLSCVEAHEAIQRILERPGSIIFTHHARQQAAARNFDDDDVYRVLQNGTVGANPDWDTRFHEWVYRVTGRDLDGDVLVLKIAIDLSAESVRIITGHGD